VVPFLTSAGIQALEKTSFLLTFSGVFAVPAGKGKLKKISVRKSSSCDKGA
jgi:hypothetical protein